MNELFSLIDNEERNIYIAKVCHEVNRAYCNSFGDNSQPEWCKAPQWQIDSAISGVKFNIENPDSGPSSSHDNWVRGKEAEGWKYGHIKSHEKLTHPCLVPFDHLPAEQQGKDLIFRAIVHSMVSTI